MELKRRSPPRALISLVPMIDVMLIMLVFFMVTSTYLNLDMIPAAQPGDAPPEPAREQPPDAGDGAALATVLIRLGADGLPHVRGRAYDTNGLKTLIGERLADDPEARFVVLPSGAADLQSLVTLMDTASEAGAAHLSVIRLEARP
ncbi:MAG: biopolymer transporter ExbD [Paracoccaceae bacterium]